MKLDDWLTKGTARLSDVGISSARLDCLILLEDATGKDRSWLLAHPDHVLPDDTVQKLDELLTRRSAHEPLAYIRGKSEFYGREFRVNAHTLQPRPETETMIDLLKQTVISPQSLVASQAKKIPTGDKRQATSDNAMTVVDVGTGSGCIAITTKLLYPEASVIAIDIDDQCLKLARKNAKTHNADIIFLKGSLLEPLSDIKYQISNIILLANLPYVPDEHIINRAATHEPRHAIFGGADGLVYYRSLFEQAMNLAQPPAYIFTEALPPQHNTLSRIAEEHGYSEMNQDDFIQLFSLETDR